jgi:hypothetical protein
MQSQLDAEAEGLVPRTWKNDAGHGDEVRISQFTVDDDDECDGSIDSDVAYLGDAADRSVRGEREGVRKEWQGSGAAVISGQQQHQKDWDLPFDQTDGMGGDGEDCSADNDDYDDGVEVVVVVVVVRMMLTKESLPKLWLLVLGSVMHQQRVHCLHELANVWDLFCHVRLELEQEVVSGC